MSNKQLLQSAGDGTAVPAGYVGEVQLANPVANVTPGASVQDLNKTVVSITLTPGVWAVSGVVTVNPGTAVGLKFAYVGISLTNNGSDNSTKNNITGLDIASSSNSTRYFPTPTRVLTLTSSTTVYLVAGIEYTTLGTCLFSTISSIQAVRIA